MRHRCHRQRLQREVGHRTALLRNLAKALIEHEMIETTAVKAHALQPFIERVVTLARGGSQHEQRLAFARLQNKEGIKKMFSVLGPRYKNRNGGYTRIILSRRRQGDGAQMAFIEFVDRPAVAAEAAPAEA